MQPRLPLSGIRVIANEAAWAGPYCTQLLADLGAEVIKIEHRLTAVTLPPGKQAARIRYDAETQLTCYPEGDAGERSWNRSGTLNQFSRNKLSMVLDLNPQKGKEVFLKLVKISDVVQDNYSARVMPHLGLDYPVLKEVNPQIIMIRQSGWGATGPYKEYVAGGSNTSMHGGLPYYMGYPDGGPIRDSTCLPDPVTAMNACLAVLIALWQRRITGKGQYIDNSQPETISPMIGDRILGYQMKTNRPTRIGNRHYFMAPHGCYPCQGKDKWIVIAIGSDAEWAALCRAMGKPSWARDERFNDHLGRYNNQDELDKQIGEWTAEHDHITLMNMLQSQGITAGAVLDQSEVMADPHIKARDCYMEIDHPETGVRPYPRSCWNMSKIPPAKGKRAPLVSEHNEYVLRDLLGLSNNEIADLYEEQVITAYPLE